MTVVFYLWTYRKCVISIPVAVAAGAAGLFLAEKGINYIVNIASAASSSSEVGNTSVSFSIAAIFGSTKSWTAWLYIVLGQVNTMVLFTGGIALFGAVMDVSSSGERLCGGKKNSWKKIKLCSCFYVLPVSDRYYNTGAVLLLAHGSNLGHI